MACGSRPKLNGFLVLERRNPPILESVQNIITRIESAKKIILGTHKDSDGDGLGSELALYFALKKIGKDVRVVNPDKAPNKYAFLQPDEHIHYFAEQTQIELTADLALIMDTNDQRLVEPLFSEMIKKGVEVIFIDHHPELATGPKPTQGSWIDVAAASTGEMIYDLICALEIEMDPIIARCLYTSITFDTQMYRYVRASSNSHRIAAELLKFPIDAVDIHRFLFGNQSIQKMSFFARIINSVQYMSKGQVALFYISDQDLKDFKLSTEDARDVIDMIMNIDSLEVAAMIRQDNENEFKISLRSKGKVPVIKLAESLGGGGHVFSAGAYVKSDLESLKNKILSYLKHSCT